MALHNIYMLNYPEEQTYFYNPEMSQNDPLGYYNINGPGVLCPVSDAVYTVLPMNANATIEQISWSMSTNLENIGADSNWANIRANTALIPSWVGAEVNEVLMIQQRYNGQVSNVIPVHTIRNNADTIINILPPYPAARDVCVYNYRKPIVTEVDLDLGISIGIVMSPCEGSGQCAAYADHLPTEELDLVWTIEDIFDNELQTGTGRNIEFCEWVDTANGGSLYITLEISHESCNHQHIRLDTTITYASCNSSGWERQIIIQPNPASGVIGVTPVKSSTANYSIPPSGMDIRIRSAYGGPQLMFTTLYASGQNIQVGNLPNGLYFLQGSASDFPATNALFVISR